METTFTPAASVAQQPPMGATAGLSSQAGEGGAPASHFGPPTTNSPDGAGGPLNRWDREIRHWRAMGKPHLAKALQESRARFAIAFGKLEPVFVPTDGQRLLYGLRAGAARDGVCAVAA